ncbi:hypothetical protein E1287_34655 [Actinomadura sp. KC06]|uniref:hypothetical protein n=1 Tax=Actinomadura sp. KC06 TaxID=2530369 RepID=UPI0010457913|nr:hypothetical protein [Actinomadura sp. KC06]TDD27360.1 hypothetical protein E1287_34655 [Actinomadura sp. KC06]
MSTTFTTTLGGPELNLHNGNARVVLELLGLPAEEPWGDAPAEDFLGRTLVAQGLLDVATDDAHGTPAFTDGRVTYGGRDPGHLARVLVQLQEIASWAHRHHADVTWD